MNQVKAFMDKSNLFLTENTVLRYLNFSALYTAQGIPEGITFFAIPAWLAMNGKTPMEIGSFVAVIIIPWSFKILIAPLMDRYTILSMGRKRPWVIFGQLGLILSFLSIAFVTDPLNNLTGLMICGFMISFFGAFQDVATDGMAIDVVPQKEQARANGIMWGSKTIGTALSLIVGTSLINIIGFSTAVASLSVAVALIMLVPIFFRERPGEKLMPWTKGEISEASKTSQLESWSEIFRNLLKVVMLPSSIIMGIASLIIGTMFGLMDTLLPVFTIQELGWTNTSYSQVYSTSTIIGGFLGLFVGGALVDFFGKRRMLSIYLIFLVLVITSFAFLPSLWSRDVVVYIFILAYYAGYTFLCIAMFAICMQLCWSTVAATQFTLFMALSNMGRAWGSGLLGPLKENFTWDQIFLWIAIFPLLMLIFIQFINFIQHKKHIDGFILAQEKLALLHVPIHK
ncbi:MAG TPA: MFS transporter [Lutibacter sp.]|nr:MFS transporter [Lutibacter sp.]